jgi:two-component system cell cycle sensor histidine kinase PleC
LTSTELVQLVETIHLSTLHLQTLVDNLLESTTIEAGIFKVHCYPINIEEVVQRASSLMAPLFNRRAQVLETSLPPELPTLWADPNRLAQVLVNLLSNASKFSPMDSKIELVISQDSEWLAVLRICSTATSPPINFMIPNMASAWVFRWSRPSSKCMVGR